MMANAGCFWLMLVDAAWCWPVLVVLNYILTINQLQRKLSIIYSMLMQARGRGSVALVLYCMHPPYAIALHNTCFSMLFPNPPFLYTLEIFSLNVYCLCDASKWRLGTTAVVTGLSPLALDAVIPARHSLCSYVTRGLCCWSHCWCVPHYM